MSQTIHDGSDPPKAGMPADGHDGYIVIQKFGLCNQSVMAAFADDSVTWHVSDFTCADCYEPHQGGYFKDDVPNKKKTFTFGYR